jgi:hypothetical protein
VVRATRLKLRRGATRGIRGQWGGDIGHVVAKEKWGVVDLDLDHGSIFVQLRWHYIWIAIPPATPWTEKERQEFHRVTDRSIWARWSNRVRLKVAGSSQFARRFATSGVPINFDVRSVTADSHWIVYAYKTPPGTPVTKYHQYVTPKTLTINLYTSKLQPYTAVNDAGVPGPNFQSTPHEFGHAIGNREDEYKASSQYLADAGSTMNVGHELRARHLSQVLSALNTMVAGTVFSM